MKWIHAEWEVRLVVTNPQKKVVFLTFQLIILVLQWEVYKVRDQLVNWKRLKSYLLIMRKSSDGFCFLTKLSNAQLDNSRNNSLSFLHFSELFFFLLSLSLSGSSSNWFWWSRTSPCVSLSLAPCRSAGQRHLQHFYQQFRVHRRNNNGKLNYSQCDSVMQRDVQCLSLLMHHLCVSVCVCVCVCRCGWLGG